ncbi:MAG TPA: MBOAT family O-acyltransferase [Afipia sp.]
MTFASADFLIFFFPLFLLFYFPSKTMRKKNIVIIVFSLIFYTASAPAFLVLLIGSIAANYRLGLAIDDAVDDKRRYRLLGWGVAGNLLGLGVFKYTGFFVENLNSVLDFTGLHIPVPRIGLPLGISFYSFHAISYIADVAKRKVAANRRFEEFMLYMSMFPQLVAGPIVRYSTVAHQLRDRRETPGRFTAGMRIFIIGLSWKLLIADQVAPIADYVFDTYHTASVTVAWLGLYAYAMQIYFDFGGYSAMAVGLGVMMGFTLPRNFRIPYSALSITSFWRRWHMSLSAWLRDYLFIPLGGSRGSSLQTYRNLWIVFLLCGLWHGASWTFVIWGAHHGLFLALERAGMGALLKRLPREIAHLYTVLVAFIGWVWFRANDFDSALSMFRALLGWNGFHKMPIHLNLMLSPVLISVLLIAGALSLWKWPRFYSPGFLSRGTLAYAIVNTAFFSILFFACFIIARSSSYSPFLYYRF